MVSSKEVVKQAQKWMVNGRFLENTSYTTDDFAKLLNDDEIIHGFVTGRAKLFADHEAFSSRWVIVLTNKRLMFLSAGSDTSYYVDHYAMKWEVPLDCILSVRKQKWLFTNRIILYGDFHEEGIIKHVIKRVPNATFHPFFEALKEAVRSAGKENSE